MSSENKVSVSFITEDITRQNAKFNTKSTKKYFGSRNDYIKIVEKSTLVIENIINYI